MSIQKRKKDHVQLTLGEDVNYLKSTGFEQYDFIHNALPETNFNEVSTHTSLLGRTFSFPLFISSMTGGYSGGVRVNSEIAEFCERWNLPFGVGSQRVMLEEPDTVKSFSVVRERAPEAFIAANIGGAQCIGGISEKDLDLLISTIRADALIIHLNPLQELMQPEGDRNFCGIEEGISDLVESCSLPIIVKETGAGISKETAHRLLKCGVKGIDVAGAGGTSWSRIENLRKSPVSEDSFFNDWGIPTSESILQVASLRSDFSFNLIGSGGIRTTADMVKAIALGANFTATAAPIIRLLHEGGIDKLEKQFHLWEEEMRMILTLLGCQSTDQLRTYHLRKV
ncbi:MAG: type 2 isopentenyl-diphosphate Delta-isomerase [Balneolaceae bacterium]